MGYQIILPFDFEPKSHDLIKSKNSKTMNSILKTITPEIAQDLLDNNRNNRPLSPRHVNSLVKEIKQGKWKINGDAIRISEDGNVIDGQHRLHAVILSKLTIQSWFTTGLNSSVFDTIDIGKKRSHSDTLFCYGEKNTKYLSSTLLVIDNYMNETVGRRMAISNTAIKSLLIKYPNVRNCLWPAAKRQKLLPPSILNGCYYLFSILDKNLADVFVDKIINGTNLQKGCPWFTLRKKLEDNSTCSKKYTSEVLMMFCIKAWNASRQNKTLGYMMAALSKEGRVLDFPKIK